MNEPHDDPIRMALLDAQAVLNENEAPAGYPGQRWKATQQSIARALAAVPAPTPGALDVERLARALATFELFDSTPDGWALDIIRAIEAASPSEAGT